MGLAEGGDSGFAVGDACFAALFISGNFGRPRLLIERERIALDLLPQAGGVVDHVTEFLFFLDACFRAIPNFFERERRVFGHGVLQWFDDVIRQRVHQLIFANFIGIDALWQHHIRAHAHKLGGAARDAVELLDRDFEGTGAAAVAEDGHDAFHVENRLDRTLAESRLIADDHPAAVILNGRGQNLAGRGAGFIGDDDQRTVVQRIGIAAIAEIGLFPAPVDRLHDRPAFDEESSQGDGFVQRTASVAAKIKHQAVDVFLHQAFQ